MKRLCFAIGLSSMISTTVHAAPSVEGAWTLSQPGDIEKQLEEAVENVVADMNFFVRSFARSALEKETKVCDSWKIAIAGSSVLWQCDQESASELPANANRYETKAEDDDRTIYNTVTLADNSLKIVLSSERGVRTNYWQLVGDNTLEYTATLESEKLPKPLTWTLTYTR